MWVPPFVRPELGNNDTWCDPTQTAHAPSSGGGGGGGGPPPPSPQTPPGFGPFQESCSGSENLIFLGQGPKGLSSLEESGGSLPIDDLDHFNEDPVPKRGVAVVDYLL
jgi:hypothetical protein